MDPVLAEKLAAAIYPATSIENISLDYNGTQCFGDLYDQCGKIIGAGGFGVVILATDKQTHAELAIKILNIQKYMLSGVEGRGKDMRRESLALQVERSLKFLKNEVSIMQGLTHPNIIHLCRVTTVVDPREIGPQNPASCPHRHG